MASNLNRFITGGSHKRDQNELSCRAKSGLASNKYKPVDYEKLRMLTTEKKLEGEKQLQRINRLQNVTKESKENNVMKQHKKVWQIELSRLNSLRRDFERSINSYVSEIEECKFFVPQIEDIKFNLEGDFLEFKAISSDKIWELRDDVKFWINEHKNAIKNIEYNKATSAVSKLIADVKSQQDRILVQLNNEEKKILSELHCNSYNNIINDFSRNVFDGIPPAAYELECHDMKLKGDVLKEFIMIDEKYHEKMILLESEHESCIAKGDTGGWHQDEHLQFVQIIDQYTSDISNRRTLYIDRLRRQFPTKSRSEIVSHEQWWTSYKYYTDRKKSLINDCQRDKKELLNKAKVIFDEVNVIYKLDKIKEAHKEKQKNLCDALTLKVQEWQHEKMELFRLENEIAEHNQKEIERKMMLEEEEEMLKRQKNKEKIALFKSEKEAVERERIIEQENRLKILRKRLAEQAEYDKERVKYREELIHQRLIDMEEKEKEKQLLIEEKEEILEILRQQVRPNVNADRQRILSETEAWKKRLESTQTDHQVNIQLQQPLFQVNSFTSKQITNDPRFKIEQQLRAAGLHDNEYARNLLAAVKPLQQPRKDMQSTVFKHLKET